MTSPIVVKIIGAPIACKDGTKDTWREVADWAAGQLRSRFGDKVKTQYYDLFDPQCPPIPPDGQLPVVIVDDVVISTGGKISVPALCRHLEVLGLKVLMVAIANPIETIPGDSK